MVDQLEAGLLWTKSAKVTIYLTNIIMVLYVG